MSKNRIIGDTAAMAFVKILSMVTGIVTTMILSRSLELVEYGTYSTGNLITTTATSLSALGLMDAVNYYYNGKDISDGREKYVNTTFLLTLIFGSVAAASVLLFQNAITSYFHNAMLQSIYVYIAFRPLITNLITASRNLHLAIGKAKFVAIRNAVYSIGKLLIVFITSIFTSNVSVIFLCILVLEFSNVILNFYVLEKNQIHIRINHSDKNIISEILKFCIPMGIYIQANALTQNMDSFVIGYFESTDKLAIYTNCTTRLPIDFISTSLLTVLIPSITRSIQKGKLSDGAELFKCYIKIGYLFTWAFGLACMILAPQAVKFLYGEKYLDGTTIFVIYIIVDMLRFANLSLILSAKGNTKTLMLISCGSLVANLFLNIVFYWLFGFIGPALATIVVTVITIMLIINQSAKVLNIEIKNLFDGKHIIKYISCMLICGICTYAIRILMTNLNCHYFITLAVGGGFCVISILALNYKEIRKTFRKLNEVGKLVI